MTRRTAKSRAIRAEIMRRAATRPTTCPTGKIQYSNPNDATEALRNLRRSQDLDADGLTTYRCGKCRRWHTGHGIGKPP